MWNSEHDTCVNSLWPFTWKGVVKHMQNLKTTWRSSRFSKEIRNCTKKIATEHADKYKNFDKKNKIVKNIKEEYLMMKIRWTYASMKNSTATFPTNLTNPPQQGFWDFTYLKKNQIDIVPTWTFWRSYKWWITMFDFVHDATIIIKRRSTQSQTFF